MLATTPGPYGPIPSKRQLKWHALERYAFVHFSINTFTDKEWGYGDESPALFDPTDFDADQIASTLVAAGLKGLVLTCKHHDGFCLWPSEYTQHCVKHSPWRNGGGDMVREFANACARHGLKFGVYLSPWDRNHAEYGRPAYLDYYRAQLRELLTSYGSIFEVWFDGANGGDGYYGGARETRTIDNETYYDWETTWQIVRELQPDAVMFSDGGPDIRWCGNESGYAGDPCWASINAAHLWPGHSEQSHLNRGDRDGTHWLPAEVDVSIRPGWFYHEREDTAVRSASSLLQIYFDSVGRGANLILNVPPDRRGLIPESDVAILQEWNRVLSNTFTTNLLRGANEIGDAGGSGKSLLDDDPSTFWTGDGISQTAEVTFKLAEETTFNVVRLREYLALGHRVDAFALDFWDGHEWREFASATSIGNCRLIKTPEITTGKVRMRITAAAAPPALNELSLFKMPAHAELTNGIHRSTSRPEQCIWKVARASSGLATAPNVLDGNANSLWIADGATAEIVIDLGESLKLNGFTLLPRQDGEMSGTPSHYAFFVADGDDLQGWGEAVAVGEFANIKNNPIQQSIAFHEPVSGRFVRLRLLRSIEETEFYAVAEIGVITDC